ncbi:hypothetical protein N7468_000349 [Penicillium chermesinum]|uniref:PQQ-binding-like beta-propeller repeat protein n=1 Tax=Penicillium chermesinum TaxID=63820 RepID=A0A9W9TY99_9EURO|nr:uncharacterized protein N7468_000349 [Penicillium chermesinum]KAJ5248898.1 hypothetical protein N7468_000349 [Penicillium chermesinum]
MEQHTLRRRGTGLRGVDQDKPTWCRQMEQKRTAGPCRTAQAGTAASSPTATSPTTGVHPDAPHLFPMWSKYRGGMMLQVDPHGKIQKQYSDPYAHHDQNHLDDGTILYTTLEPLTPAEAARVRGGIPGSEAPDGKIYADCIKLVDPWSVSNTSSSADFEGAGTGGAKLLWSWRAIDHLDGEDFAAHQHYPREHWPLINSVSFDSEGNIIASSRNASSVFVISRANGEVLWRIAAPTVCQQHCAHQINEEGDMLVLDNGVFRPGLAMPFSRAIVVSKDKQVKWEYKDRSTGGLGFFTPFMGSAQKLGNGNFLICEAATGRVIEVTADGEMAWEFVVPHLQDYKAVMDQQELAQMEAIGFSYQSNAIFRAYKYLPEEIPWLQKEK